MPLHIAHRLLDRLAEGQIDLDEFNLLARRWADMVTDAHERRN